MQSITPAALLFLTSLAGCSQPAPPDPNADARSNLAAVYTLSNGAMVPMSLLACDGPTQTSKKGVKYIDCRAILQGYAHQEIHYCETVRGGRCEKTRPE